MNCPRCPTSVLNERDRDGLVVDVCPSCRGVWLDRGELEKLIARATREYDELGSQRHDTPSRGVPHADGRYARDDSDRHERDDSGRYPRRKRSWFDSLGDIFD